MKNFIQIIAAVVLLHHASAKSALPTAVNGCIGTCSTIPQFLPHEDPYKFCQCDYDGASPVQCRTGTIWDQLALTCIHDNTSTDPATSSTTQSTTTTTTEAPKTCIGSCSDSIIGYLPHGDIHFFCICDNNKPVPMQCAPGTVWNQIIKACDHESVTEQTSTSTWETTTGTSSTTALPSTTTAVTSTSTSLPSTTTEAATSPRPKTCIGSCLEPNNGYLPHEDIHFFCRCDNNKAVPIMCAPGTIWSQSILTCDHEGVTTWEPSTTTSYSTSTGIPSTTTWQPSTTTKSPTTTWIPSTSTWNPSTTTWNPSSTTWQSTQAPNGCIGVCEKGGYLPHEDKNYFCQCSPQGPKPIPCRPGTVWDQMVLTCVHDVSSTSESSSSTGFPSSSTITTTEGTIPTSTAAPNGCIGSCAKSTQGYLAHANVNKFCQCVDTTTPTVFNCPNGTIWNQDIIVCVHDTNTSTTTPITPTTSAIPTSSTTLFPSSTTNVPTSSVAPNGCVGDCAAQTYGYLPHIDKTYFCQCEPTGPRPIQCKKGTVWSQLDLTCVHG